MSVAEIDRFSEKGSSLTSGIVAVGIVEEQKKPAAISYDVPAAT
jgi:hypothetical protein